MSTIKANSIDSINSSDHIQAKQPIDGINQCTAWGVYNGTDGTLKAGYNIASVVHTSTGASTITFLVPMDNTHYAIGGISSEYNPVMRTLALKTVNGFQLVSAASGSTAYNVDEVSFVVFGGKD